MAKKSEGKLPSDTNIQNDELGQIILTLEDNSELVCDIIAMFPCTNGHEYIALLPEDDPDGDFFLYRCKVKGDDIEIEDIEDDDEFEEASDAFDELMDSEEFDEMFDDEDDDQ